MLNAPRILYICDHAISSIQKEVLTAKMVKSLNFYDMITQDSSIGDIYSAYKINDDSTFENYYLGIDIEKKNMDSISWISSKMPSPGDIFYVEYMDIKRLSSQYTAEDCPRCGSNGWYLEIFGDNQTKVKKITGSGKLVQDFLKVLLTYKKNNYGTTILDVAGTEMGNDTALATEIAGIVFEAETMCKKLQLTDINAGTLMSDAEKLKSAIVTGVEVNRDTASVHVSIVLLSEENTRSQLNLMI